MESGLRIRKHGKSWIFKIEGKRFMTLLWPFENLQNYEENHSLELDWRAQRLSHTNPSTQQSIKITSEHKPEKFT